MKRKIDMDKKVESMATALEKLIEDVEVAESILRWNCGRRIKVAPLLEARAALAIWKQKEGEEVRTK
jgi:hypothetical protein